MKPLAIVSNQCYL